ncbi:MAG: histidinol-phosphatase HisJ family protein [bacterium]|nr:histidinol-phosphatase HisJ family protein [bacterium]
MHIDLHNHTRFSYDSNRSMEETVIEAIEKNVKVFGFSDHLDFNENDPGNEYYNGCMQKKEFERLSKKYEGKIELLLGIEASLENAYSEKVRNAFKKHSFRYRIMSAHFVEGIVISDWIERTEREARTSDEVDYSPYFDSLKRIVSFQEYDILGHIDYYKKYSKFTDHHKTSQKHEKEYREILKKVVDGGKVIEVNTSGLRHSCREQFPSTEILRLYRDVGGEFVATGSDSHKSGDVAFKFDEVYNIIDNLGLKILKFK